MNIRKKVTVYLPQEEKNQLIRVASENNLDLSPFIRHIIFKYIRENKIHSSSRFFSFPDEGSRQTAFVNTPNTPVIKGGVTPPSNSLSNKEVSR